MQPDKEPIELVIDERYFDIINILEREFNIVKNTKEKEVENDDTEETED